MQLCPRPADEDCLLKGRRHHVAMAVVCGLTASRATMSLVCTAASWLAEEIRREPMREHFNGQLFFAPVAVGRHVLSACRTTRQWQTMHTVLAARDVGRKHIRLRI